MNKFIKILNKYVILLIIDSLFGKPWFYVRYLLLRDREYSDSISMINIINTIPTYVDYLFRIIVIILLIIDFKKHNLKGVVFSCIAALFYPLLGITLFAILLLLEENSNQQITN